jgi:tRNA 2-thiocytidine biosynthesis protein TtcA
LRKMRQAINDFQMIKPKEKVIVGISGWKDSMVMAWLLDRYNRIIKDKFEIRAFYVSGWPVEDCFDFETYKKFFDENFDFTLERIEMNIPEGSKLLDWVGNRCQWCAYARRISLMKMCKKIGATKIILWHHMDDIVTTTMINMIQGRKLKIMPPVNKMRKWDITFIRPIAYLRETEIKNFAKKMWIPHSSCWCSVGSNTMRNNMKYNLIWANEAKFPNYTENIFWALIKDFKEKYESIGYSM